MKIGRVEYFDPSSNRAPFAPVKHLQEHRSRWTECSSLGPILTIDKQTVSIQVHYS